MTEVKMTPYTFNGDALKSDIKITVGHTVTLGISRTIDFEYDYIPVTLWPEDIDQLIDALQTAKTIYESR